MSDKPTVAIIGLGAMGLPIAYRLNGDGYPLVVPRHSERTEVAITKLRAKRATSPSDAVSIADVLITMLPDTADVQSVARGRDGIFEGATPGLLWIDMSTISPVASRELASTALTLGIKPLDAPVSGGTRAASEGTLSMMIGGDSIHVQAAQDVLSVMASKIVHVGPAGAGQVAKAANQMVVGGTIAVLAEALTLAAAMGCDPSLVRQALLGGFADSRILAVHGQRMIDRTFAPGFRARLQRKDLAIALDAARSSDLALPVSSIVHEVFSVLCAHGGGDLDHSSLITAIEAFTAPATADGSRVRRTLDTASGAAGQG